MKTAKPNSTARLALALALAAALPIVATAKQVNVNVVLNTEATDAVLSDLANYGKVGDVLPQIRGLTMKANSQLLSTIQSLSYVAAASEDAEAYGGPSEALLTEDFLDGISTWDQDAINVTDFGVGRVEGYTGEGVYVAVLDTGLLKSWRSYFPEERIAEEYGMVYGGGGNDRGNISTQPDKWQQDVDTHGTHVASTVIGYAHHTATGTRYVNGVAPLARIIPVKVLNQAGWCWWSMCARGITYVGDLKAGPLADHPVVINMSLGGATGDPLLEAAIDYAIAQGVIIVVAAGNDGNNGMNYPGAYPQVISAAAAGWTGNWFPPNNRNWWWNLDVTDPMDLDEFYIAPFSSREFPGQDLDVAAPGRWVVGPWETQHGKLEYRFVSGTSMATPHVAGIIALMLEKNPTLTTPEVEVILEAAAVPLPPGCREFFNPNGEVGEACWGSNATGAGLITADRALALTPSP